MSNSHFNPDYALALQDDLRFFKQQQLWDSLRVCLTSYCGITPLVRNYTRRRIEKLFDLRGNAFDQPLGETYFPEYLSEPGINDPATLQNGLPILNFRSIRSLRLPWREELQMRRQMSAFTLYRAPVQEGILFSQYNKGAAENRSWALSLKDNPAQNQLGMRVTLSADGTLANGKNYESIPATADQVFDRWAMIGFTFSEGVLRLYIDGQPLSADQLSITQDVAFEELYNSAEDLHVSNYLDDGAHANTVDGDMLAVLLFDTAVSDEAAAALNAHFRARYGLME
ncbi:MAG: hypothetical protein ACOC2C_01710 [Cyclonatronaceae bacterium]